MFSSLLLWGDRHVGTATQRDTMPPQLLGQCQPGLSVIRKESSLHCHNKMGIPTPSTGPWPTTAPQILLGERLDSGKGHKAPRRDKTHSSLSFYTQGEGSCWPAQSRVPSTPWNTDNQSPAERLLTKIRKSLSKRTLVAQNCPFRLLFAPLLPIKECVGTYQNSVKLILSPTPPSGR